MYELSPRNLERARVEVERLASGPTPRASRALVEVRRRPRRKPGKNGIPPRLGRLIGDIERAYDLLKGDIYIATNTPRIVAARRLAFVVLRQNGLSYPEIGRMFGMHHTTVLHHVKKVKHSERKTETG